MGMISKQLLSQLTYVRVSSLQLLQMTVSHQAFDMATSGLFQSVFCTPWTVHYTTYVSKNSALFMKSCGFLNSCNKNKMKRPH